MAGSGQVSSTEFWASGCRRGDARYRLARRLTAGLVLTLGLVLGACAVQFGPAPEDAPDSSEQTPRDRNRLYQDEQQRMYQQRQLDRSGPSDR